MKLFKKFFTFLATATMVVVALAGCSSPSENQKIVDDAKGSIVIGDYKQVKSGLVLPKIITKGDLKISVKWTTNVDDIMFQTYDENNIKAAVTRPAVGEENIPYKLSASVEYKDAVATREFSGIIMAQTYVPKKIETVAKMYEEFDAKTLKINDMVTFTGIVSFMGSNGSFFFLSDGTNSIAVYGSDPLIRLGDKVTLEGKWSNYNTLYQLSNPTYIEIESRGNSYPKTPTSVSVEDLYDLKPAKEDRLVHGKYYEITGVVQVVGSDAYLYSNDGLKGAFVYGLNSDEAKDFKALAGKKIKVVGVYYTLHSSKGPNIALNLKEFPTTEVEFADADKNVFVKNVLSLPALAAGDVNFPASPVVGTTITWESSHPAIIANDGKYVAPATKTEVILTATVTSGTAILPLTFKILAGVTEFDKAKDIYAATPDKTATGTTYYIKGIVVGANIGSSQDVFVQDNTGVMYVKMSNGQEKLEIGQEVILGGKLDAYNALKQLTNIVIVSASTDKKTFSRSNPTVKTATEYLNILKSIPGCEENTITLETLSTTLASHFGEYFEVEGYIIADGAFYNMGPEADSLKKDQIQLTSYTNEQKNIFAAQSGKKIKIRGYFSGTSASYSSQTGIITSKERGMKIIVESIIVPASE